MATAPGAAAPAAHAGMGMDSRTCRSITLEEVPSEFATSKPKLRGPVRIFCAPLVAGSVTSSSVGRELEKATSDGGKATPSSRTAEEELNPEPKILTPLTDCGRLCALTITDCARLAGFGMLLEASTGGVTTDAICSGLI